MFLLWRTPGICETDWLAWTNAAHKLAMRCRDTAIAVPYNEFNIQQQLSRVNSTPGQRVVWLSPHFLPSPGFETELDSLRRDDILIVGVREYRGVFNPGQDKPALWEEQPRVLPFPLVFQLAGQTKVTLPNLTIDRLREWVTAKKRQKFCYVLPAQYIGRCTPGPIVRSRIGDVYADCWDGATGATGQFLTGGAALFSRRHLREEWAQQVEYVTRWLTTT